MERLLAAVSCSSLRAREWPGRRATLGGFEAAGCWGRTGTAGIAQDAGSDTAVGHRPIALPRGPRRVRLQLGEDDCELLIRIATCCAAW